jgi:hypothetical protein
MRHNLPDPLVEGSLILVVAGTGRCEGVQVMKGVEGLVGVDARRLRVLGDFEEPRQADGVEFVDDAV